MSNKVRCQLGGEELILETGRMAKQANGAVYAEYAGSAVLATVCCSEKTIEGLDYVPLQVEYNEKAYAAGKIPGSIFKREGRPKDREILVSRLIDRPLRPLFSKAFKRDIQVVPTVISADQVNPPDVVAMVAASAAVAISDIPFDGPVGAVRVADVDGALVVNPTYEQRDSAGLEIVVAGTATGITMVEGGAEEASEERMIEAIGLAHQHIRELCELQVELAKAAGRAKLSLPPADAPLSVHDELWAWALPKMQEACFVKGKFERSSAIKDVSGAALAEFADRIGDDEQGRAHALLEDLETHVVRESILDGQLRTDGRGPDDIRPISCEIDVLPRAHGAALFTRGETQALALTTLGSESDELRVLDALETDQDTRKGFMLHYNFPPFSVGETGRLGTGRREVGHGHLAERALEGMIPAKEEFPYTIRLVSEILESNGSSSMASVCGGTLSLLNAGVPIKKSVAGIAMGLVTDGSRHVVISDILGEEDHLGDMDFKVAGTADGITAFQMDIKVAGVDQSVLRQALEKAKAGRLQILEIMAATIDSPRDDISDHAPKIMSTSIPEDKIGALIGPGGANIRSITEQSGADVNIRDDGTVLIYARRKPSAEKALQLVEASVEEPEVGKDYDGVVKRIMDFGAFVEFLPGKEGLLHISKISREHVESVSDVLELGQEVKVRLIEIDRLGRANLANAEAFDSDEMPVGRFADSRPSLAGRRGDGGRDRDGGRRDGGRDRDGGRRDGGRDRDGGRRDGGRDRDGGRRDGGRDRDGGRGRPRFDRPRAPRRGRDADYRRSED